MAKAKGRTGITTLKQAALFWIRKRRLWGTFDAPPAFDVVEPTPVAGAVLMESGNRILLEDGTGVILGEAG